MLSLFWMGLGFVLLTGCSAIDSSRVALATPGTYPIDSQLREFYQQLGGIDRLGPAIAEATEAAGLKCQYTSNVRICLNSNASSSGYYYLDSIGHLTGLESGGDLPPYSVYPDFDVLIQEMGGNTVGQPLGNPHYNYDEQRVEQYFENAGLYHHFNDPAGVAALLPYGDFACGSSCSYTPTIYFSPAVQGAGSPFSGAIASLGGEEFSGQPITSQYVATDGMLEQVFENFIIFAPPDQPDEIQLRNLPLLVGMYSASPAPQKYDLDQNVVFIKTVGELGYHVPVEFDKYINEHGGMKFFGLPIAEITLYEEGSIYRQCFEKICLDYYPSAEPAYKTRPAPLGRQYVDNVSLAGPGQTLNNETVILLVSTAKSKVASLDPQAVYLLVVSKQELLAYQGIESEIILRIPDGTVLFSSLLPATGPDGRATIVIPSLPNLPNGTLIGYQVCLRGNISEPICANGSYLIWNN